MDRTISPAEWIRWMALYQLEPWGALADDDRMRTICRLVHAANFKSEIPYYFDRDPEPIVIEDEMKGFFSRFHA